MDDPFFIILFNEQLSPKLDNCIVKIIGRLPRQSYTIDSVSLDKLTLKMIKESFIPKLQFTAARLWMLRLS